MKYLIFIKTFLVITGLILFLSIAPGCTTFEIPEEVCTYGLMTCDAGQYICNNYELPPAVCTYFNVACVNLEILCNSEPGSNQYKTALKNLNDANIAINTFIQDQNPANGKK